MLSMHAVAAHWGELPPRAADPDHGLPRRHEPDADRPASPHLTDARLRLRARALSHLRARLLDPGPGVVPGPPSDSAQAAATMSTASADRLPAGPDSAAAMTTM